MAAHRVGPEPEFQGERAVGGGAAEAEPGRIGHGHVVIPAVELEEVRAAARDGVVPDGHRDRRRVERVRGIARFDGDRVRPVSDGRGIPRERVRRGRENRPERRAIEQELDRRRREVGGRRFDLHGPGDEAGRRLHEGHRRRAGRKGCRDAGRQRFRHRGLVLQVVDGHAAVLIAGPETREAHRRQIHERIGQHEVLEVVQASLPVVDAVEGEAVRDDPATQLIAGHGQDLGIRMRDGGWRIELRGVERMQRERAVPDPLHEDGEAAHRLVADVARAVRREVGQEVAADEVKVARRKAKAGGVGAHHGAEDRRVARHHLIEGEHLGLGAGGGREQGARENDQA